MLGRFIQWSPLHKKRIATSEEDIAHQTVAQKKRTHDNALIRRANLDTPFDIRGYIHTPARRFRLM